MNFISVANETIRITEAKKYTRGDKEIALPDIDLEEVVVITPDEGKAFIDEGIAKYAGEKMCEFSVVNADSFQAGSRFENALVMNFANAHAPGGGFRMGATAQEEALCRCSTLYASINSGKASEMYRYNNTHPGRVESDYMLLSRNVVVFRDEKCNLIDNPRVCGVITAPAPNRRGAAIIAGSKLIEETFIRRIRIILIAAARYGYKDLVLGAWGCGVFGNKAEDVAGYFKQILVDEEYGKCFKHVCFAVFGRPDGENITSFKRVFS